MRTYTAVEYLRRAAPRTRYASQFGHMLRILEIYDNAEKILGKPPSPLFPVPCSLFGVPR